MTDQTPPKPAFTPAEQFERNRMCMNCNWPKKSHSSMGVCPDQRNVFTPKFYPIDTPLNADDVPMHIYDVDDDTDADGIPAVQYGDDDKRAVRRGIAAAVMIMVMIWALAAYGLGFFDVAGTPVWQLPLK